MSREPKTIHTLKTEHFTWHHSTHASEKEINYLEERFAFHPLDIKDCLPTLQRPKLIARDAYIFLILQFPIYNRKTEQIEPAEVDFFIGNDFLVTIQDDHELVPLKNFFEMLDLNKPYREELFFSPAMFFEQLLDELMDASFPMLLHISNDIEALNRAVLQHPNFDAVKNNLRIKNNLVAFKKAMQPHKDLFKRLEPVIPHFLSGRSPSYTRLINHTKEIWDNLETYSEAVNAVQDTQNTIVSYRLNETMRKLTALYVIIAALGLFVSAFSMRAGATPFVEREYGFWILIGFMITLTIITFWVFKRKKWL